MRRFYTLFASLLVALTTLAQTAPTFSSGGNDVWYYVRFKNGGGVLADRGEAAVLTTSNALRDADHLLWKVEGTLANCQLVSKAGRRVFYNGSRFAAKAATDGQLFIKQSTVAGYTSCYEIGHSTTGTRTMNQFGGTGIGVQIGAWDSDRNNPLEFVAPADMVFPDVRPTLLPETRISGNLVYKPTNMNTLWYIHPSIANANEPSYASTNPWMEYALPIGDGQFGAMVFGGVRHEKVQFNDKTLWSGGPASYGYYRNFGEVYMKNLNDFTGKSAGRYTRYLDLSTATAGVTYTFSGTTFTNEYIASHPARAVIMRLKATGGTAKINQLFSLYNANGGEPRYVDGVATFKGDLDHISYESRLKVIALDGTTTTTDSGIVVRDASEVMLILVGETNFDAKAPNYLSPKADIASRLDARLAVASASTWDALYAAHLSDYQPYFNRVKLELTGAKNDADMVKMITRYNNPSYNKTGTEPSALMLEQLYFNYGRYLMIAGSRGVDLPTNLQGIWNDRNDPPWHSDIHANINVQMNYWPAEPLNMSDLHKPFLNYIYDNAITHPQWKRNAISSGQTKGWTIFTENNIFGYHSTFALNYVIANAWYTSHLWQHYRYTQDRTFLKDQAFPVLKSAADFWLERIVKERRRGEPVYVAPNEYSPEHGPGSEDGVAHAQQLIWDLFNSTLQAIDILGADAGVSEAFKTELRNKFDSLDTGLAIEEENGIKLLREWKYSNVNASNDKSHRHMSHLMALHPLSNIHPSSPYFEAMRNSMLRRGDAATGWSMGWKINLWARLLDGDHAHLIMKNALKHSTSYVTDQYRGGIYYNLFDSHAPFQIDGNFGTAAGVAEMLLQSHLDTLHILPALPSVWKDGSITGMKAVGNFTVDLAWKDGKPTAVTIVSNSGRELRLKGVDVAQGVFKDASGAVLTPTKIDDNTVVIPTTVGATVQYFADATLAGISQAVAQVDGGLKVDGRTVAVSGTTYTQVFDLKGQMLLETAQPLFTLPATGRQFLITRTLTNGTHATAKVVVQ